VRTMRPAFKLNLAALQQQQQQPEPSSVPSSSSSLLAPQPDTPPRIIEDASPPHLHTDTLVSTSTPAAYLARAATHDRPLQHLHPTSAPPSLYTTAAISRALHADNLSRLHTMNTTDASHASRSLPSSPREPRDSLLAAVAGVASSAALPATAFNRPTHHRSRSRSSNAIAVVSELSDLAVNGTPFDRR